MAALSNILRSVKDGGVAFWCPGCNKAHRVNVGDGAPPRWGYNGNPDSPTLTPSILITCHDPDGEFPDECCHSFVTDGRIQFLGDCTHPLAGQTVALPPWPHALNDASTSASEAPPSQPALQEQNNPAPEGL